MGIKLIREEDEVLFDEYADLSYLDERKTSVKLYIKDVYKGNIKVWKDSDEDDREYICLNYEIVYLDTLTEKFSELI